MQEKIKFILETAKTVSARKLDPKSKGSSITKLKKGKNVSQERIDEIYLKALELSPQEKKGAATIISAIIEKTPKKKDEMEKLNENIEELPEDNEEIAPEIEKITEPTVTSLKAKLEQEKQTLEETKEKIKKIKKIKAKIREINGNTNSGIEEIQGKLGIWKMHYKPVKDKSYLYARLRLDKKTKWVYIGDREKSKEKILAWEEKYIKI